MILGICEHCEKHQKHESYDLKRQQFYCEHNQVHAIRDNAGEGWTIRWPVTRETYQLEQENAMRTWKRLNWKAVQ